MNTRDFLLGNWHWDILLLIIIVLFISLYLITNSFKLREKSFNYFSGIILLMLATLSPLDYLSHDYLFSAHMVEHIILLLIVPPLLLTGTNKDFLERVFQKEKYKKIGKIIFNPLIAWFLGVGSMWFWHIPSLFKLMKIYPGIHIVQMLLLIILGLIFIWPVFTPIRFKKMDALQSIVYLFSACVGCTLLGILITFAPAGMYNMYYTGSDAAVLNLVQNEWGITPKVDQQIGGLIMWVPACMIYLTNIMIILFNWYKRPKLDDDGVSF